MEKPANPFRYCVVDRDVRTVGLLWVDSQGNYDIGSGFKHLRRWKTYDGANKALLRVHRVNPSGAKGLVVQRIVWGLATWIIG